MVLSWMPPTPWTELITIPSILVIERYRWTSLGVGAELGLHHPFSSREIYNVSGGP